MVDIWSRAKRSDVMSKIRSKNTLPEVIFRSLIHRMGFRYRLHGIHLPGRPDLVFPKLRIVIFVNGCFWHMHAGCNTWRFPKSNIKYWRTKLRGNVARDVIKKRELRRRGWTVVTVWECEIERNPERIARKAGSILRRNWR